MCREGGERGPGSKTHWQSYFDLSKCHACSESFCCLGPKAQREKPRAQKEGPKDAREGLKGVDAGLLGAEGRASENRHGEMVGHGPRIEQFSCFKSAGCCGTSYMSSQKTSHTSRQRGTERELPGSTGTRSKRWKGAPGTGSKHREGA